MALWHKISIAVIVLVLIGGGLWLSRGFLVEVDPPSAQLSSSQYLPPEQKPRPGYELFFSLLYRFSLEYPNSLKVTEYHEGDGTTMVFENEAGDMSFQIFVVPYSDQQISAERFKMDVPSGVMNNPQDIEVDGARARAFESVDVGLGETHEVWILNNGFLYEVTTEKSLEEWLSGIMNSWQFI